jgi:hypothetical protein
MSSITFRIATGRGAREPHAGELCRYITRPAISEKRLSISPQGTAVPAQDAVVAVPIGIASVRSRSSNRPVGTAS